MKQNKLERLERFLVRLIKTPEGEKNLNRPTKLLLWLLRQLSRIYRAVIQMRLLLYRKGIFRHHTLGCQVISVGNLTVGGTGKTPVVEIFARELQKAGRKVAVLSRGYKKQEPPFLKRIIDKISFREFRRSPRVVSDGSKLLLNSAMSGDEPYMLASNLPEVVVLVDKNRVKSGRYAVNKLGCDTLVLDDGFQYMALKHRVEIVLVDKTNPFGNERVLPRGILREPVKNIKRANFIFITKSDGKDSQKLRARLRELNSDAEITECCHCARYLQDVYSGEKKELSYLKGLNITVVSGIAAPGGFEKDLEQRGAKTAKVFRFADHHRYAQQEIIDIINKSKKLKADAIITTEKDAVRFPLLERRDVPIFFLRVDIEILSGALDLQECISRICFKNG
ncbi:tetraacyldisaccharide 4'-kinase [Verrucomicrobiota bacterium]